jgi:serine/threonine protein phosphatase PrpC
MESFKKAAFSTMQATFHDVNQDRGLVVSPFQLHGVASGDDNFIIGVFDGHGEGGEQMAEFAANNLSTMISSGLNQQPRPWDVLKVTDVLTSTFRRIHEEGPNLQQAGSTASIAVRLGNMLYLANAGDSTTFLATYDDSNKRAEVILQTVPHKPNDPEERARIEQHGGVVQNPPGPGRSATVVIDGNLLAMSRSLGDRDASSSGVIPDPTVLYIDLSPLEGQNLFVVSATDGLLDVISVPNVAKAVGWSSFASGNKSTLREVCAKLINRARDIWYRDYDYGPGDDVTVAVRIL